MIAAGGVHSVVARRLGMNPGWAAAAVALDMMEESPRERLRDVDPSAMLVRYRDYAYVFRWRRKAVQSASGLSSLAARYRRACNYEIGTELRDSIRIQRYLFADLAENRAACPRRES